MNVSTRASINKKNNNLVKFLVGAAALFLFIFILNIFSSPIKNIFYAVSSPIQKTFFTAGESSSGFLASIARAGSLSKENQNLQNENQKLYAQVASLQSIINGNQAQSNVSLACQNSGFKLLMAGVTGLDQQDIISINKGSSDGVLAGMPVINQQNALFGKISKVYKNFSEVMLISNKNSIINVKIQQQNPDGATAVPPPAQAGEIDGVIKGKGQMGVYLDLVPIDSTINKDDILVTSALEGTFPKDLLVGKITQVQKNDQNPHQQAQVQPFFNVATDNLFVITNYKQSK